MVNDGPVLDTRPPGYGCGPSFGMLGPSRLVVTFGDIPSGWEHYEGGVALGYVGQFFGGSPPYFAQWRGIWDDLRVSVFLSLIVPATGFWRINCDVNTTPAGSGGTAIRETTNFTWQFPQINLTDGDLWTPAAVFRIAEWQTITKRFPAVAFPEEV